MPGIPLTTQTHSWVSGESRMGKNKVSFNREQCRAWETRWLCFPPQMSQCRKQGRAIFKTPRTWKQTLKQVWVVLFIHRTTHRCTQKTLIYSWQKQTAHTWWLSDTSTIILLWFSLLWVQAITSESTQQQHIAVRATQHHGTHLHGQLTRHLRLLDKSFFT